MPFYNVSAGAHILNPPATTYHNHQETHTSDDVGFPFGLSAFDQPTLLSQRLAPLPTNIDPRLMLQQEPHNSFNSTAQVLPDASLTAVLNTEVASTSNLSSFNANHYNQYFLPNGTDEFLYEPLATDRFEAVNISGTPAQNAVGMEYWQL